MSNKELFFLVAILASVYFFWSSFHAIQQYDKKLGLERSQKNLLYSIAIFVPLLGFLLTRRLGKRSA